MNLKRTSGAAAACAALHLASSASAEDRVNEQGRFTIGIERVFGVVYDDAKVSGSGDRSISEVSLSILSKGEATPFSAPRVGVDYFVIDGLSLGTAIGYGTLSVSGSSNTTSQDLGTAHSFIFAPRVGYAYMFSPVAGIWPRAGVTYASTTFDASGGAGTIGEHAFGMTLEVPFLLMPVPHVAFMIAPTFDYGFSGSIDAGTETVSTNGQVVSTMPITTDIHPLELGLQAGMLAWF